MSQDDMQPSDPFDAPIETSPVSTVPGVDDPAATVAESCYEPVQVAEPVVDLEPDPDWDDIEVPTVRLRVDRTDLPPVEPGFAAARIRLKDWAIRVIDQPWQSYLTLLIVAGCAGYVLWTVHPNLVFQNSTPTGGDMGAHVWGPMYLLKHVLPHGRVSGWTPDWYAGFPAFQYYMIGPALAIVAVHVGLSWPLVPLAVLAALALAASGFVVPGLFRLRKLLLVIGLLLAVLAVPVPYNISFKLITVMGLVTLPISAWAFAKLADLRFPAPPMFALAALVFIYNREPLVTYPHTANVIGTGNIIGGNMASTMAGEYSFSIALSISLLYFGVLARGLKTGRHRALAAGLLAMVGLCHLLPFFFALLATVVVFLVRPSWGRVKWLAATLITGCAVASFWMFPFYWRRTYTIDMGFEQLPEPGRHLNDYLAPHSFNWIFLCAGVGLVVALAYRNRVGVWLAGCCVATTLAVFFMPQIQLWNARVLPFYYLSLFLLAAYGLSGVFFSLSTLAANRQSRPAYWVSGSLVGVAGFAALTFVGLPLRYLPFAHTDKLTNAEQFVRKPTFSFGGVHVLGHKLFAFRSSGYLFTTKDQNSAPQWATWNYTGYEGKTAWPEYSAIIGTMKSLGNDPAHGCGRAMWETDNDREGSYGTPMALMLLPYWTNSCIGSMEGLYFESSATTPYHFLNASELADKPSNPERDLPYPGFNLQQGVAHLRMLGVKYYLADSTRAVTAADADTTDLQKLAVSGPWHVYQVRDSALVEPLTHEPVVWNVQDQYKSWVQPTADWYLDETRWSVPFASTGPKSWKRVKVDPSLWTTTWSAVTQTVTAFSGQPAVDPLPKVDSPKLPKVNVSNIRAGTDTLNFDVDKVGVPVLVKISYYPNWHVSGGKGPYRVTPNLMVVIPTSRHVRLHYGLTPVDYTAWGLTFAGVGSLAVLSRLAPLAVAAKWRPFAERDVEGEGGPLRSTLRPGPPGTDETDETDDGAGESEGAEAVSGDPDDDGDGPVATADRPGDLDGPAGRSADEVEPPEPAVLPGGVPDPQ